MITLITVLIVLTTLITLILNTRVIRKHIYATPLAIAYHYKSKKGTVSLIELRKIHAEIFKNLDIEDIFKDTATYELYDWGECHHYDTYDEVMHHVYKLLT